MVNCELDRSPIACKAAELELWTRVRASLWIACMDALGALLAIVADGMDRAIRGRAILISLREDYSQSIFIRCHCNYRELVNDLI